MSVVVAFAYAIALLMLRPGPATSTALLWPSGTIQANDNRIAAGRFESHTLHIALEARAGLWYPDGPTTRGIPMLAFAEAGKPPLIPGPLVRVPAGTDVVATIHNQIPGVILRIHGLVDRPAVRDRPFDIGAGDTRTIRFRLNSPGTYYYWASTTGAAMTTRFLADSQLSGAIVVDAAWSKTPPGDRIFVIGRWVNARLPNGLPNNKYELNVINGREWPYTERLSYGRGELVRWRVINTNVGSHPMHLHGFFFNVDSRGNGLTDRLYKTADRDQEVTEFVRPGDTFSMSWTADRPGGWLFHCHHQYHIIGHLPVGILIAGKGAPSDTDFDNEFVRNDAMGGLILAVTVRGRFDPQKSAAPVRRIQLIAERGADDRPDAPVYRFVVGENGRTVTPPTDMGPTIILERGQPAEIDVTNKLSVPTSVHWHGIELQDSYYDGVVAISGEANRHAPAVAPNTTFAVRFTPPRAGTFIYHSHTQDLWQYRAGLAGPLIVVMPGTRFDPTRDHIIFLSTPHALPDLETKVLLNGSLTPSAFTFHVGVPQRLRFINITTSRPFAVAQLEDAGQTVRWTPIARDGMDLPRSRRKLAPAVCAITIGQTRDFQFTPTHEGELFVRVWAAPKTTAVQTIPIRVIGRHNKF